MPNQSEPFRTRATSAIFWSTFIFIAGCGDETESQFKGSRTEVHPSSLRSYPIKPKKSSRKVIAGCTPLSEEELSRTPANLNKKPLPASAYIWKKDEYLYSPANMYSGRNYFNRCVCVDKYSVDYETSYGTMLDELFSIREIMRTNYIFHDEVVDLNPNDFVEKSANYNAHLKNMTDKDSYFQHLRSSAKLADGSPKHDLFESTIIGPIEPFWGMYNFDILWDKRSEKPPRDYLVKYVGPNSPGQELVNGSPKVKRGDKLVKLNGIDFISTDREDFEKEIDYLLEPKSLSDVTKFVLIDRDTKKEKTVSLTPRRSEIDSIDFTKLIETDSGMVGYISLGEEFNSFRQMYESIKKFKKNEVKDVVLDIRYYKKRENIRDTDRTEPMLLYTILGKENTEGKQFRYKRNRDEKDSLSDYPPGTPFYSKCLATTQAGKDKEYCNQSPDKFDGECSGYLWLNCRPNKTYDFDLKSLNLDRVYLLTSAETCHVGELIINGLLGIDVEVIQIGEQTCGSSYVSERFISNCGIRYELFDTEYANNKKEGDYPYGFKPADTKSKYGKKVHGCFVTDDLSVDLGDPEEDMLSAALHYRKNGTCPKATSESNG